MPSSHDAKSSAVVAWVHLHGRSMPWPLSSATERRMKAALRVLELYNKQLYQNANRLEALTARHWPELLVTYVGRLGSAPTHKAR